MAGKTKKFHPTITAQEILQLFNERPLILTELETDEMEMYHGIIAERLLTLEDKYKDLSKKYKQIMKDIEKKFELNHFNQLTLEIDDKRIEYVVEEKTDFKIKKRQKFKEAMLDDKEGKGLTVTKAGVRDHLEYFLKEYPDFVEVVHTQRLNVAFAEEANDEETK